MAKGLHRENLEWCVQVEDVEIVYDHWPYGRNLDRPGWFEIRTTHDLQDQDVCMDVVIQGMSPLNRLGKSLGLPLAPTGDRQLTERFSES